MDYVAGIGSLLGGLISSAGQLYANHQHIKAQKSANAMNAYIAAMNNATQIEMANSAHQREVADLKAAGLNPILSASGSGAVTPRLSDARMDAAQVENPLSAIGNSAATVAKYLSADYQAQVDDKVAHADYTQQVADLAKYELAEQKEELLYNRDMNRLRRMAFDELTTTWWKDDRGVWRHDYDPNNSLYKWLKEGIEAQAKDASNINWRHNVDTVSRAVNSAAAVGRLAL